MAKKVLVMEEILAMLNKAGASSKLVENFKGVADTILNIKQEKTYDEIAISSGFGQKSQRGYVDLTINDEMRVQMDIKKAKEVGLMLIEAAEAATSDEIFIKLLDRIGIRSSEVGAGNLLLELREIRQGTRGVVRAN